MITKKLTFIISDLETFPGISLVSLRVDVELVTRAHNEAGFEVFELSAEPGKDSVIRAGTISDQEEVSLGLKVQVFNLEGDDGALVGADGVKALETARVLARVVG